MLTDPLTIPRLNELMAKRIVGPTEMQDSFKRYFGRSANPPFKNLDDLLRVPEFVKVHPYGQNRLSRTSDATRHYAGQVLIRL